MKLGIAVSSPNCRRTSTLAKPPTTHLPVPLGGPCFASLYRVLGAPGLHILLCAGKLVSARPPALSPQVFVLRSTGKRENYRPPDHALDQRASMATLSRRGATVRTMDASTSSFTMLRIEHEFDVRVANCGAWCTKAKQRGDAEEQAPSTVPLLALLGHKRWCRSPRYAHYSRSAVIRN